MAKRIDNDISEFVHRAETDVRNAIVPPASAPSRAQKQGTVNGGARDLHARTREPGTQRVSAGTAPSRKRRSTFNIIAWLFISAIAIVFYIGNILKVNRLAVEVHQLQVQYERTQNANNILQAEINRKSGWDRIGSAASQHGLIHASEKPGLFDVDEDKLDAFKDK